MKKNEIIKIYGEDFKENTLRLLEEAGLEDMIDEKAAAMGRDRKSMRIALKPNLVSSTPASYGATTHPELVAGLIEYLQAKGFENIRVMEGSWVGDRTKDACDVCGYTRMLSDYHVPFTDTQSDSSYKKDCAGVELVLSSCTQDVDYMINVPVLKGHCQTKMTCALKNMKGLIPNKEKRRFHTMGLHKPIAHLSAGIKQDFILVDHICGDLDFEDGGNPVTVNCIMAGADPVLVDSHVCQLLGIPLEDVPYIGMSQALGSGSADTQSLEIRIIGSDKGPQLPRSRKLVEVEYAVTAVDSCSACYGTLVPVLARLKDEGLLDGLKDEICIGQGYRGQTGKLGVGMCTSKFGYCIKGCPPTEKEIYDGLKAFIAGQTRKERS